VECLYTRPGSRGGWGRHDKTKLGFGDGTHGDMDDKDKELRGGGNSGKAGRLGLRGEIEGKNWRNGEGLSSAGTVKGEKGGGGETSLQSGMKRRRGSDEYRQRVRKVYSVEKGSMLSVVAKSKGKSPPERISSKLGQLRK